MKRISLEQDMGNKINQNIQLSKTTRQDVNSDSYRVKIIERNGLAGGFVQFH